MTGFEGAGRGLLAGGPAPFSSSGAGASAGPGAASPGQLLSRGLSFCPQVSAPRLPGATSLRPHGGLRGEPAGQAACPPGPGGPAGGDRGARLQLLEHLLTPRPAAGGGGGLEPGPAHRGGPRAPRRSAIRTSCSWWTRTKQDRPEGGRLRPP